jgi:long-chain fatty acid transport protein
MKTDRVKLRRLACGLGLGCSMSAGAAGPALTALVGKADNAEIAFTAPAGMSRLQGTQVTVQGMFAQSFSSFDVDENKTTIDGGDPDNGSDPVVIPFVYYVRQLNDRWHGGLSLTIPSGFGSNYGNTWAGRYQTVDFSLVYVSLTPAVSYRVNERFSLGMGVGINYTAETSENKIPLLLSPDDGKIKSDLDGVGINVTLSAFYEFSNRTRAGISWTSDSDADLEGTIKLRKLDPIFDEIATDLGIKNIDTKITNTLPQRVLAGMYHEFESGDYFTIDGMWMKFSDFSVSNLKLDGNDVNISTPSIYNDLWAINAGYGFRMDGRKTYRVGAMYLSQGVDDDDRNFSIRVDQMWAIGAGVSYALNEGRRVDANLTFLNTGEAPVDQTALTGRVAGKNDDPYALLLELTYSF